MVCRRNVAWGFVVFCFLTAAGSEIHNEEHQLQQEDLFWERFQRMLDGSMVIPGSADDKDDEFPANSPTTTMTTVPTPELVLAPLPTATESDSSSSVPSVQARTSLPTAAPSHSPNNPPTKSPIASEIPTATEATTTVASCPGDAFEPIANKFSSELLQIPCQAGPSVCEEEIEIPFSFPIL